MFASNIEGRPAARPMVLSAIALAATSSYPGPRSARAMVGPEAAKAQASGVMMRPLHQAWTERSGLRTDSTLVSRIGRKTVAAEVVTNVDGMLNSRVAYSSEA